METVEGDIETQEGHRDRETQEGDKGNETLHPSQKRKRGKSGINQESDQTRIMDHKTRSKSLLPAIPPSSPTPVGTSSSPCTSKTGTSSRPQLYLLRNNLPVKMPTAKLPKNMHLLRRFIDLFMEKEPKSKEEKGKVSKVVSKIVAEELKNVWELHFGIYVVSGKKSVEDEENDEAKMIIQQYHIANKILKLYQDYKNLEKESNRPGRCETASFKAKEEAFKDLLDTPTNITKADAMEKLKVSPILQWKEDWEHLQNQLQRDLPGTLGSKDRKQERRDDNTLKGKKRAGNYLKV